ncbi:glycosyltransferase family 39 protein, partial [candidate division WWE3 bacterium]|nr:glycosyltransferase family 39 protein [candidate division WWE3 bacterium]
LSAVVSAACIPVLYLLVKKLFTNKSLAYLSTLFLLTMTGFIQYAHFATYESLHTFFYLCILLISISILSNPSRRNYYLLAVVIGLAIGSKVTNLYLLVLPLLLNLITEVTNEEYTIDISSLISVDFRNVLFSKTVLTAIAVSTGMFLITNPYSILDYHVFLNSILFESNVATGAREIFYTREFINTTPVLYQITHVFPFISGYLFTAVAIFAVIFAGLHAFKNLKKIQPKWVPVWYVYGAYAVFNLTLFVKWTRYMVPLLPALIIVNIWFALKIQLDPHLKKISYGLLVVLLFEVTLRGVSFFTIYTQPDTRIQAAEWVANTIPAEATILIESNEPNSIVFRSSHAKKLVEFDFYELSQDINLPGELQNKIDATDYYILSSRRVFFHSLKQPNLYPKQYLFYSSLFNNRLELKETKQFSISPCIVTPAARDSLPRWLVTGICPINTDSAESTFVVFDHPTVTIYEKDIAF